ncbi:ATP-dependent Clp protease adaptor ClpS [Snodgrassella communis]|nr:ATP-dependent Clp protease adapter ClpS [Snodgrassella communis]PIT07518.1 ATP-dependent Clp protease adaptor ClpS [Snodgrassella communis]PIT28077.1 ATP-dependent Clp protease adaptor ClpS [Snodgrassella communis]PIT30171.1 ATP-dependent Clp protease adaptor ClpS [Snodgrassella communis]PIT37942.1 ATP-dependent Clp protease adaptor ClpS [Snodgrassella communis]
MSNTNTHTVSQNQKTMLKPPKRYKVVLLNDDYTPMEFVVEVLTDVFHLPHTRAIAIMLMVHESGRGVCGVFQKDIAETKCNQVMLRAEAAGFPLQCLVEEA